MVSGKLAPNGISSMGIRPVQDVSAEQASVVEVVREVPSSVSKCQNREYQLVKLAPPYAASCRLYVGILRLVVLATP